MYALFHERLTFGSSFSELASVDQRHPNIYFGLQWPDDNSLAINLQHVISRIQPDSVQADLLRIDDDPDISFDLQVAPTESTYSKIVNAISPQHQERFRRCIDSARALLLIPCIYPALDQE
jgi:hypothetical protein